MISLAMIDLNGYFMKAKYGGVHFLPLFWMGTMVCFPLEFT